MIRSYLVLFLVVVFCFSGFAHAGRSFEQKEVDEVIKNFLSAQSTESEDAQSVGNAVSDLDGDGKPEIVLLWVLLGPTYSNHSLTVFSKTAGRYKPGATFPLMGTATNLAPVKGGIIRVDQEFLAKNDRRCCPSIKKQMKYRWLGRKILEVKK
jgi:hypothetical protein